MKKITFLVASLFIFAGVANASEIMKFSDDRSFPINFANAEPITFNERGIEFYVFADGQFDFNTEPSQGEMYYRNGRRGTNATFGAPATTSISGVKIEHDSKGRVRRIGNVFVNYDSKDRIKRIGSVYMTYNNFALTRVGNLQLIYNRRGQIIDIIGAVKGRSYVSQSNTNSIYYGNSQGYNNSQNDNYYYRTETNTKEK